MQSTENGPTHGFDFGFKFCVTTTATMIATMAKRIRVIKKHIHLFFLAARADATAFTM
jgi:hypothetical protein